ncbi:MAG: tetratricopeptide repeat-containing sensor histidine kinase [Candidatus Marinimicrobia bacterium]|nr:tetratricopeptide repeat-containing sensor histidine kinase [Candidatus Neomarinimicrobiota bacterium]
MKKILLYILLLPVFLQAGTVEDSLRQAIREYKGVSHIDARLDLAYLLRRSDFETSRGHAKEAYRSATELKDAGRQAEALYFLGLTYYYNNVVDTSLNYLKQAEAIYRSEEDHESLAKVLSMIGTSYLQSTGDQGKAISYYNEALIHARKHSDHKTMAVVYSQLSNIFRLNGAYQQAIEFIYNSKEEYEKAGFEEGVAWINYSIGRIYTAMSLYDEAEGLFLKGLNIYSGLPENTSTLTGQAICLDELTLVYMEQGNLGKALHYNSRAYHIYKDIDNLFGLSNSLKYLANIEFLNENFDPAIETLKQSLKIKKAIPDVLGLPGIYNLFGKILRERGKYQQALDSLNTGLQYAVGNNQKNRIMDLNHELSNVYLDLGQYKKAYQYQSRHLAIMDSIYMSKATRGMTQLEALYDLDAKQRRIDELQQNKTISELRLKREKTARNLLLLILGIIIVFSVIVLRLYVSNRKTNIALEKSRKKLQELNATKDRFFSIIAHDLKSPFNSILGFSSMLERYCKTKDYRKIEEFSGYIRGVSEQTFRLLENLLEWARSQTGNITYTPREIDISATVQNAVDLVYTRAMRKGITFGIRTEPSKVQADENMLHTVLHNLFSNAVKYSQRGGVIHVEAAEKDGMLEIRVRDEGIGMDEATRKKLFSIDENVSRPGTEGEAGTGLGLIISREFIEKHHGSICVESEPGKGSCFILRIPLRPRE